MVTKSDPLMNVCRYIIIICGRRDHDFELKAFGTGLQPQALKAMRNGIKGVQKSEQAIEVYF